MRVWCEMHANPKLGYTKKVLANAHIPGLQLGGRLVDGRILKRVYNPRSEYERADSTSS